MEIEILINKKKDYYSSVINLFDAACPFDDEFELFINELEKQEILKDSKEIQDFLHLLLKITNNHHRYPGLIDKLSQIFLYIMKDKQQMISNSEIFQIFKTNKLILFILFDRGILTFENSMMKYLKDYNYLHFLYPSIKRFLSESVQETTEANIYQQYNEKIDAFTENCKKGENDSYICTLIRQDSIEDFITYFNKENLSPSSEIKQSIFETNSFLIGKSPTLTEYSIFYGSIQIFQYLRQQGFELTESHWIYAVRSNNAEIFQILEEEFPLSNQNYKKLLKEAIQCYHNNVADYIINNLMTNENKFEPFDKFKSVVLDCQNYYFLPNDISEIISRTRGSNSIFNMSDFCLCLSSISIPSSVKLIGYNAFYGCSTLCSISIPSSVTKICNKAFYECSKLTKILIPSSVASIGNEAFRGCSSVEQVVFENPSCLTSIGEYSFKLCLSLKEIVIPLSVVGIGNGAFSGCSSLVHASIPSSVDKIGDFMFYDCSKLSNLTIPSSVSMIGNNVFNGCTSLANICIPSSVIKVGDKAFYQCTSLTEISFPASLKWIGDDAFAQCNNLAKVKIPKFLYYRVCELGIHSMCIIEEI